MRVCWLKTKSTSRTARAAQLWRKRMHIYLGYSFVISGDFKTFLFVLYSPPKETWLCTIFLVVAIFSFWTVYGSFECMLWCDDRLIVYSLGRKRGYWEPSIQTCDRVMARFFGVITSQALLHDHNYLYLGQIYLNIRTILTEGLTNTNNMNIPLRVTDNNELRR